MTDPMTDEEAHLVCALMRRFFHDETSLWYLAETGYLDGAWTDATQEELQAMEKLSNE